MAQERNREVVLLQDFSGGYNAKWSLNATQLEDNQSPYLYNIDYSAKGAFTKRRGFQLVGPTTAGTGSIKSVFNFTKRDGTEILIRTYSTVIQALIANVWTNIGTGYTADLNFDFAVYQDTVYMGNGTDSYASWDGTAPAVTATGANPKGNIYAVAGLRLWIAGIASNLTRLDISAPDDFTNFASAGATNVSFQSPIRTLVPFFDKESTEAMHAILANGDVWQVGFDSTGTIYKKKIRDRSVGSLAHRATKQVENANFVLNKDRQISGIGYEAYFQDVRSTSRSVLIDTYLTGQTITRATAEYLMKNYILSYQTPLGGSNNEWMIFDENYSSWRKYIGVGANHFTIYQNKLTWASSSDLNIYQANSLKYDDNSAPIYALYQTKDLDFGEAIDDKTSRYIKIAGLISAGCELTVNAYVNGDTSTVAMTKTILGSGDYVADSAVPTFGSDQFASIPFAGFGGTDSSIELRRFWVALSVSIQEPFSSLRLEFLNEQKDVDFVITDIKAYGQKQAFDRIPLANIL